MKAVISTILFALVCFSLVVFSGAQNCEWSVSPTGNDTTCDPTSSCSTIQRAVTLLCSTSDNCPTRTLTIQEGEYTGPAFSLVGCGGELNSLQVNVIVQAQGMVTIDGQGQSAFFSAERIGGLTIKDIVFQNGFASNTTDGLVVIKDLGTFSLQGSTFQNSQGPSVVYWNTGGGEVRGCTFLTNTVSYGVLNIKGTKNTLVVNSSFTGNTGSALVVSGKVVVQSSTFFSNVVQQQSGVIRAEKLVLTESSQVWSGNNITQNTGSGIYEKESMIVYQECIISGNVATNGGAAYLWKSRSSFVSSTITDNEATSLGGAFYIYGVFNENSTDGVILTGNSILRNKAAQYGGAIYCINSNTADVSGNTIQGNLVGGVEQNLYCQGFCNNKQKLCLCNNSTSCLSTGTSKTTPSTAPSSSNPSTADMQSSSDKMHVANQAPFAVLAILLTVTTIATIFFCGYRKPNKI